MSAACSVSVAIAYDPLLLSSAIDAAIGSA